MGDSPPANVFPDTFGMTKLAMVLDKITTVESNMQSSPLLRLSAEIRNQIFANVLGGHDIRLIPMADGDFYPDDPNVKAVFEIHQFGSPNGPSANETYLALTLVCRQIYTETTMLPFILNTLVFGYPEQSEKWLARKFLPAQQNAITTVKCPVQSLFFEYHRGSVATRHCTVIFKHLEGLKRLVLMFRNRMLTEEEKDCIVTKVRMANGKDDLEVSFTEGDSLRRRRTAR
ncbi:hypothetical protein EK21DRAFT_92940 [Setomelanomma holmii]|uniref:DUF7730 domain-containing protein n=1 Tax=Setomelanomma holmii TaxID=210430 RepID=A0A9P4LHU3_9PLEO|nr:hypothetical protein EK21DRAFT_92940 [Setomelanomma holmii]